MTFQAYLDTVKAKTGLGPREFRELAAAKGFLEEGVKTGTILAWLKEDFDLGSGHGMAIVSTFKVQPSDDSRLEKQFAGPKARWRQTFDSLLETVRTFGDVETAPTDTYVSLVKPTPKGAAKFAIVAITADRTDVGIKLKSAAAEGRFEAAGSWNSMVTHRVRITDPSQVDAELVDWLQRAYDAA
jgi:hypothetical protein